MIAFTVDDDAEEVLIQAVPYNGRLDGTRPIKNSPPSCQRHAYRMTALDSFDIRISATGRSAGYLPFLPEFAARQSERAFRI